MLKKTKILNPALLQALAGLGQNDYLVIANAAFPVDAGIPVIDLSLIEGVPTLEQVLDVVASELELDSAITPSELPGADAACDAAVAAAEKQRPAGDLRQAALFVEEHLIFAARRRRQHQHDQSY